MRTLNIKYTYCVTLNNKLDGYVKPPQIIVLLLQQKDVQLCNDYKSFSQLFLAIIHVTITLISNSCTSIIISLSISQYGNAKINVSC